MRLTVHKDTNEHKSNLIYALAAVTSLALRPLAYRSGGQDQANERNENHAQEIALGAAQDEMEDLSREAGTKTKDRGTRKLPRQ